jgi:hypothetical protein
MALRAEAALMMTLSLLILTCLVTFDTASAKKLEQCERNFNELMRSKTRHKAAATTLGLKLFKREHGAMACGFAGQSTMAGARKEALRRCKSSGKRNGDNRPCKIIFLN